MEPDWQKIHEIMSEGKVGSVKVPPADQLKSMYSFHGWEGIGAVMDVLDEENRLHQLVRAGVPFEQAMKMYGCKFMSSSEPPT